MPAAIARAVAQGARVVLFTDIWGSPIERRAEPCLRAAVRAPSGSDSTLALNLLVEALIAEVQRRRPGSSAARIAALERMVGASAIFGSD